MSMEHARHTLPAAPYVLVSISSFPIADCRGVTDVDRYVQKFVQPISASSGIKLEILPYTADAPPMNALAGYGMVYVQRLPR